MTTRRCAGSQSLLTLLALLLTACGSGNDVAVTIRPDGEHFSRSIELSRKSPVIDSVERRIAPELDEGEWKRLRRVYGDQVKRGEGPLRLSRRFQGAGPDDLGGRGALARVESPLGTVYVYRERFGGTDDAASIEAARRLGVRRLAALVRGWLTSELRTHRGFPGLRRFLDTRLENDLDNLTLLIAVPYLDFGDEGSVQERAARAGLYLYEHGYVASASPIPLGDLFGNFRENLKRLLRDALGVPAKQRDPRQLAFLADDEALGRSIERFMRGTRAWRRYRKLSIEFGAGDPAKVEDHGPTQAALYVALEALGVSVGLDFMTPEDALTVRLHCPVEPLRTNGTWADGVVTWKRSVPIPSRTSTFFHADWAEPDIAAQTRAFGRVIADGEELERQTQLFARLDAEAQADWHSLQARLEPAGAALELKRYCEQLMARPEPAVTLHLFAWGVRSALVQEAAHDEGSDS